MGIVGQRAHLMIHHGDKDLMSLRMTKSQLASLYAAIGGILQKSEEPDAISEDKSGQRPLL